MTPFIVFSFIFQILNVVVRGQYPLLNASSTVHHNPKLQQSLLESDIDLINKEMLLTERVIQAYSQKLQLLKQYKESIPSSDKWMLSSEFMKEYLNEESVLSIVEKQLVRKFQSIEAQKLGESVQSLSSKQFANKISKKICFKIEYEVKETFFLNTFPYKSSQGNMQSYMVVAQLFNNTILFYDLQGQQIVDPYTPGHKIQLISLVPRVDEVIISTLGTDGIIKMVRLENKKIRINSTNEDDSNEHVFRKYVGANDILVEDEKLGKIDINKNADVNATLKMQQYQRKKQQLLLLQQQQRLQEQQRMLNMTPYDNFTIFKFKSNLDNKSINIEYPFLSQPQEYYSFNNNTKYDSLSEEQIIQYRLERNQMARRQRNSTGIRQLNATANSTRQNKPKTPKQRKPEKFKFAIKREGKFKLQDNKLSNIEINYTSFLHQTIKGTKIFLLGDSHGNIHTYFRNGTLKGIVKASNLPVIHIIKSYPNTIFATPYSLGQLNPMTQELVGVICEEMSQGIVEIQSDSVSNSHFYILTEKNEVILIEIKGSDNSCKIKQKLHREVSFQQQESSSSQPFKQERYSIATIKNSLMLWNLNNGKVKMFNTSDLYNEQDEFYAPFEINFYMKNTSSLHELDIKSQKQSTTSTLLLVHDQFNSSSTVTLYEVSIPQKQESDFINNIRGPILIVAALIFIGYQYFKKDQDEEKKPPFSDINLQGDKKEDPAGDAKDKPENEIKAIEADPQTNNNPESTTDATVAPATPSTSQESSTPAVAVSTNKDQTQNKKREQRIKQTGKMHDIDDVDYLSHLYY